MRKQFLILTFLFLCTFVYGQDLNFYADIMVNASEGKHRTYAGEKFNNLFLEALKSNQSFNNKFDGLKWVSVKSDKANTFKLFTWNVKDENDNYKNFGVIQKSDGKLFILNDGTDVNSDATYETLSTENWFGALYYNIKEIKLENSKPAFLLFGYDGYNEKNHVKVLDVLTFNEEGTPEFGKEIFKINDGARPDLKSRITIEYSGVANVNFNFNEEMDMIIHDFIVTRMGINADGSPAKIPDGTYVAYKWDGKYWNIIEQLANQVSNPNDIFFKPKPSSSTKKDIFGKTKQ